MCLTYFLNQTKPILEEKDEDLPVPTIYTEVHLLLSVVPLSTVPLRSMLCQRIDRSL